MAFERNKSIGPLARRLRILAAPRFLLIAFIHLYRVSIGLILGGRCRFYPSCSHYGIEALRLHGAWDGSLLIARRLCRCHPFNPGGLDFVPPRRFSPKECSHV